MTAAGTAPTAPLNRTERSPLPPADPPKRLGATPWLGGVMAAALAAVGVVALRDAAVAAGWLPGPAWTVQSLDLMDGLGPSSWQLLAGPIAILLGIGVIVAALSLRRRRWFALGTRSGIYLGPGGVARLATATAQDVDGVVRASSACRWGRLTVRIESIAGPETVRGVAEAVRVAVDERMSILRPTLRTQVRQVKGRGRL